MKQIDQPTDVLVFQQRGEHLVVHANDQARGIHSYAVVSPGDRLAPAIAAVEQSQATARLIEDAANGAMGA